MSSFPLSANKLNEKLNFQGRQMESTALAPMKLLFLSHSFPSRWVKPSHRLNEEPLTLPGECYISFFHSDSTEERAAATASMNKGLRLAPNEDSISTPSSPERF
ncbi:hypothetical protein Csa_017798 [Cucumis sativus]|nr:hypothetical protein Csa_017798 [Cucumis sativus]